eukprot:Colp12_sorted_trinity150504_noHs@14526
MADQMRKNVSDLFSKLDSLIDATENPSRKPTVTENPVAAKSAAESVEQAPIVEEAASEEPTSLPEDVALWSESHVSLWLGQLGFEEYTDKFKTHRVTGKSLIRLDRAKLTQLGVSQANHAKMIEEILGKRIQFERAALACLG